MGVQGKGTIKNRALSAVPTLGGRLRMLVLVTAVPLVVSVAVVGGWFAQMEQMAAAARLADAAQSASRAVDAEIERRRAALEGFAAALDGDGQADLQRTDAAARRLAAAVGTPVGVLDRGLGLLVDTDQPFGTPLGSTPAIAAAIWAVETGRPRVSDLLVGAGTGPAAMPQLLLPLMQDNRAVGVLSIGLSRERLTEALGRTSAVLVDSRGRPVASRAADATEAPDWLAVSAAPRDAVQHGRGGNGATVRFIVTNLAEAPEWHVLAWEPAGLAASVAGRMLPWGVAMVLLALALAVLAWRRSLRVLGEPVQNAERYARAVAAALAADTPAPAPPELHGAEEFAELGAALAEAHAAAIVRDRRLRALAEAGALVLWRADAAGGWTEAAGWAGLTGQTAPAFRGDGWLEMLHRDDRAPTLAEWGRSLVARSLIGVEFRLRMADETAGWRWVRATGVPITSEDGQILEWVGAIHDVAEARGAGQAHRFNEAQVRQTVAELRAVYDTVPVGLALVDPDLRFVNVNARFATISGLPTEAHIGRAPHEVMPDGLSGPLQDAQRRVFETGRPMLDVACSGPAPGAVQHLRHWLASCHPVKDAAGNVTGVSAVLQDVTERVRAERSRELLVTELNHRVKNTLSTVQAIAAQSLRGTAGAAGVGREFVGRLQALMRSHDLLSDQGWQPVDLARVVRAGLMPWIEAGRPIRIGGSGRIQATPSQTQALVLALGELAGNATRHGALSRPGGEVEVAWSLAEDGLATLDWRESGGPPVTPPPADRRGFGIRLLERGLVHDLGPGADVRLRFPEDGVEASVRFRAGQPSLVAEEAA